MKNIYYNYVNDDYWLIKEAEWVRELQAVRESQFTLGNGYLGLRGIYEEIPYDCTPGTYISGIYDKMTAQVSELVNLPNPINFKMTSEGEKIDVIAMDIISHKRVLNMKMAVLARHTKYKDSQNRCYDYQSVRFISGADKNIGVMQIALTPLDDDCQLDINSGIDTSVSNSGVLTEGKKKHFRVKELGQEKGAGYLIADTFEKKHTIVYWAGFYYEIGSKKIIAKDNVFSLKLKKDQTVIFTKVFCIKHYQPKANYAFQKNDAFNIFNKAFKSSFYSLLKKHTNSWDKLWKRADVIIEGTESIQKNIRFNVYHMLICGHCDSGSSSIGARTLSGEGYRGHIFWDAEIFLLPYYLFTFPKIAKNMLLYRYKRLNKSREIAKQNGYKGAQFAWESGDDGTEETPEFARDIDRAIIKIHTHKMEHHITADVAYAVYKYYVATQDYDFMEKCGFEIFIETARFWASRVEYNKNTKKYEINNVIGPDEFHVNVNNNAFTNMMAKWNLVTAGKLVHLLKKKPKIYKNLKNKLAFTDRELKGWKEIAAGLCIKIDKKKVIEQFDGFFKLKKINLSRTDENGLLLLPKSIKTKSLSKTQTVKQADVLILMYLLNDVFNKESKEANYKFYISRTVHKSSLSAPMHAFSACDVGDLHRAYNFFNVALRTDISNLYGNTSEGIHAASLGGTWQALVFGFGGIKIRKEILSVSPRMPRSWRKLIFSFVWRQAVIKFELTNEVIRLKIICSKSKNINMYIFGKKSIVKTNRFYTFQRHKAEYKKEEYY